MPTIDDAVHGSGSPPTHPHGREGSTQRPASPSSISRERWPKPELLATGPNQLWSWDITKLKGPVKWSYHHLYVLLDVFSRYVPGWLLAHHESGILADRLIDETVAKEGITEGLTIHADPGTRDDEQAGSAPHGRPGHREEPQSTAARARPLVRPISAPLHPLRLDGRHLASGGPQIWWGQ